MGTVQYMAARRRGQFQEYRNAGVTLNNIVAVITSGRMTDDNLKSQIKN